MTIFILHVLFTCLGHATNIGSTVLTLSRGRLITNTIDMLYYRDRRILRAEGKNFLLSQNIEYEGQFIAHKLSW